jgi:hypothetical protein
LAAPGLFGKKGAAKDNLAAVAIAAPGSAAAQTPVEAKALSDSDVAALTSSGRPEVAATDAAAEESAEPAKPKPKRKAAPKKVVEDIPY